MMDRDGALWAEAGAVSKEFGVKSVREEGNVEGGLRVVKENGGKGWRCSLVRCVHP